MGESDEDLVDVVFSLRELDPDSVPVNFLIPFEGTPLAKEWNLTPQRCLRILAMVRFVCPDVEVRLAGGREVHLRTLQPLALHLANSIFLGDYLTSEGQAGKADLEMIADAGFEVEGAGRTTLPEHRARRRRLRRAAADRTRRRCGRTGAAAAADRRRRSAAAVPDGPRARRTWSRCAAAAPERTSRPMPDAVRRRSAGRWTGGTSGIRTGRCPAARNRWSWSRRAGCGCGWPTAYGGELVDGMSSWWSAIHGYNHPVLNEAARDQLDRMSHVMFGGLTHEPAVRLAKRLVDISPEGLEHVFLADSGSVSVEVAVKMCLQYWRSLGRPDKQRLLTWRGGYHGDTWQPMSVCDPEGGMHELWSGVLPRQVFADAAARPAYDGVVRRRTCAS